MDNDSIMLNSNYEERLEKDEPLEVYKEPSSEVDNELADAERNLGMVQVNLRVGKKFKNEERDKVAAKKRREVLKRKIAALPTLVKTVRYLRKELRAADNENSDNVTMILEADDRMVLLEKQVKDFVTKRRIAYKMEGCVDRLQHTNIGPEGVRTFTKAFKSILRYIRKKD